MQTEAITVAKIDGKLYDMSSTLLQGLKIHNIRLIVIAAKLESMHPLSVFVHQKVARGIMSSIKRLPTKNLKVIIIW